MKTLKTLILIAACTVNLASASDSSLEITGNYTTGTFQTFNEPNHVPTGCSVGVNVILDEAKIMGKVVSLTNFVEGFCTVWVDPTQRLFRVTKVESAGCGSMRYEGVRYTNNGFSKVEVIDHRTRLCEDIVAAQIIVTETDGDGNKVKTFSSPSVEVEPIDTPSMTCMAYWEGFEFNKATGACEQRGASGCQDPFEFNTLEKCEQAYNL